MHLLSSIQANKPLEISRNIEKFIEFGEVKYREVLKIPFTDRIPLLAEKIGEKELHAALVVLLTQFCNCFNVIRPMSAGQIVVCAYEIMKSSQEDYLSVEDVVIFLDGAKLGKYGRILDRLDTQTIFELFESYRQSRHEAYLNAKEERDIAFKSLGPNERSSDSDSEKEAMRMAQVEYLKSQIKQES